MFKKGNIPWSKGKVFVEKKKEIINCKCGCGEKFNKYDSRNRVKYFIQGHNSVRSLNPNWNGGIYINRGYITENIGKNYKRQHRRIVEEFIGRPLKPEEHIHHKNGDKMDNRIENLQIVSNSEHGKLHAQLKKQHAIQRPNRFGSTKR